MNVHNALTPDRLKMSNEFGTRSHELPHRMKCQFASNVVFEPSHNICCVYDETLPKMTVFKEILPFMRRLPIQKALTDQHKVFKSHVAHFWKNAKYDEENDVINSSVSINGEDKEIIITEQLVREVLEFPDDDNSPTGFPERMVKGCMLRMGYNGPLKKANYLKACFMKPYKFFIHSVIHALSHRKGGYDVMKDYQMCMVTALVLNKKYNFSRIVFHYMKDNITSGSKSWMYPRFVQMMLDHAYPNLVKDEQNDLMLLHHMDNETLIRLSKYTKNWPEPKKIEFFGFIKSDKYEDPDPVNHLKWRNDAEMKEKSAIDELTKLEDFCETRNDWYTKEEKEKKKKSGKRTPTPKFQTEEGSSSQPQKKRKKKAVETLLVDEPEEDETEANVEKDRSFVNDDLVKKLQKKVDEVSSEKKKLEKRVKSVESENTSLLKKVEIDILKVRIAVLEEEKARSDEQNEYFKLKNQELEAKNAKKEHEEYMLKKVLEDLIGKPIEQRFEEIELEEVRARREAEIEAVHSDDDDDGNDDADQGNSGLKLTETSHEEIIDNYLQDNVNEEPENAGGEGEHETDP
ncbi:hypothetical protein HanLR1_Chr09g0306781 [Helianthus annuus]|nr:hypothetical protein HanHA89_Chr09g0327301 [Helianthus annuus]KAJ0706421.1 hypothetical protein HanLR1_Chr09g0306781 [Helianthus annuus]